VNDPYRQPESPHIKWQYVYLVNYLIKEFHEKMNRLVRSISTVASCVPPPTSKVPRVRKREMLMSGASPASSAKDIRNLRVLDRGTEKLPI